MPISKELELAIEKLRKKKPTCIFVDNNAINTIENPDALSVSDVTIFKNGGRVNGADAVPFAEVTGELRDLLRLIF